MSLKDKIWIPNVLKLKQAWRTKWYVRWAVYALPVILVLGLLSGVLNFFSSLINFVSRVLAPAFATPTGRFVAFNLLILIIVIFTWKRAKKVICRLFGCVALKRFLGGISAMARDELPRAIRDFQKVTKIGKTIDLSLAVPEYPEILTAAHVKLGVCFQQLGDVKKSTYWIETAPMKDLPPALKKDRDACRALVYDENPELLPETVEKELKETLSRDGKNTGLLRALRERLRKAGNVEEAVRLQEKLVSSASPQDISSENRVLAVLLFVRGRELLAEGQGKKARTILRRAMEVGPDIPLPFLLLGDLEAEKGNIAKALSVWGQCPSLPALERLEKAMCGDREAGVKAPAIPHEELLTIARQFPYVGTLTVVARYFFERGDFRRARNSLAKLLEIGVVDHRLLKLLGDVERAEGNEEGAQKRYLMALKSLWSR